MTVEQFSSSIQIENSGDLKFFFIGTGSAFSKVNYQNNVLVIKGKDHLLIDCGTTCPIAMHGYNTPISAVKNLLITHSHADHIGGLEELALMGRYITKVKPRMIITNFYKKILWEQSLKGGCSYGEKNKGAYMKFDDYFDQLIPKQIAKNPRPLYEINIGSINVKLFRTKHIPDNTNSWKRCFYSLGVLIDDRILFTSDTRFDMEMLDWLVGSYPVEYIFHDCQFFTGGVHAGYDELKTLPESIKGKMFLCHYGDTYKKIDSKKDGFLGFTERGVYYNFGKKD